ncbi:MAG TPA: efflux transporter outer membrane subunit [Casimicrobiaceae bacterium]|nr:efflux transporter outer membrane subunit [Casimicrobiaceae bacterium]
MRPPAAQRVARGVLGRSVVVIAALVALAGCAIGPDFARPVPPQEDRYTAESLQLEHAHANDGEQRLIAGASLSGEWWTLFHSEALDGIVKRALAGNRTLRAADATLTQMQELVTARAGALYPQVQLEAGVGGQKYGAQFLGTQPKPPPFKYFAVGPSVSYALDFTGGVARSVEQQAALAEYQRQQVGAAYLAVSGNAVMQALRIAALDAQIRTVGAILDEDRRNLELVRIAFSAGSVSRLDIVSAESQLANDATLLPPLRQERDIAQHTLAVVLGEPPAALSSPALDLDTIALPQELPVDVPSELAHRRPDILAAEAQLHAATAAVGVANANLYPSITLSASTGQQATDLAHLLDRGSNVWSLAAGLIAPLFDGGTLHAQQRASVAALHASIANYEQTVLTAFGQVADVLTALEHDAEALDALSHARAAAESNLTLTRASYNEGNVGVLQVLDAERQYQQARLGYVKAGAQRYLDTAQLLLALGGNAPASTDEGRHVALP